MATIAAGGGGERKEEKEGERKGMSCTVHRTNVGVGEGGRGRREGTSFPSPEGDFFLGSPYLADSESFPRRQNVQANTLDQKDAPS